MWVGGVAASQTSQKKPNHPQNRLFRPKFHLSFSQISQKNWGGWMGGKTDLGEISQKKHFLGGSPLNNEWLCKLYS